MNKQQQHSIEVINAQIALILRTAEQEQKRFSFARKKTIEAAYSSLILHARKLGLHVPQLSTFYKPEEYVQHCQMILSELHRRDEKG